MFGNGFYHPYMYQPYYQAANMARNLGGLSGASSIARNGIGTGLGKGLLSKFSFSGFLNGASKTLNVVNQAIPIFYQVRPMINNAKTMFKIIGAVQDNDSPKKAISPNTNSNETHTTISYATQEQNNMNRKSEKENDVATENPVFFI